MHQAILSIDDRAEANKRDLFYVLYIYAMQFNLEHSQHSNLYTEPWKKFVKRTNTVERDSSTKT